MCTLYNYLYMEEGDAVLINYAKSNVVLNAHHGQAGLSIAVAVPVVERIHPGVSVLSSPVRGGGRRLRVILIHLAHQLQPLPASVKRKQGGIKPAQNQRKI